MFCDYSLDSRLRGNDRHLHPIVIPAKACLAGSKAGIQTNYPNLLRSYVQLP